MFIAADKSRSAKCASRQPAFMDSCLTFLFPVYLVYVLYRCLFLIAGLAVAHFDIFQGQNYVALLRGNEMSAGFHYRNWILGI